jgi:hypothetical protein
VTDKINLSRISFAAFLFLKPGAPSNITDYLVEQQRMTQARSVTTASNFYHSVGSRVLYSQCKWLPSDSEYFNQSAKSCGSGRSIFSAVGGFLEEPDLTGSSPQSVVYFQGRLRWIRSPLDCSHSHD